MMLVPAAATTRLPSGLRVTTVALPHPHPRGRGEPGFVVDGYFYTKGSGGYYRLFATTKQEESHEQES